MTDEITPIVHDEPVEAAPAEMTAADRLRAFEDEVFGKDTPRINGGVERGIGSPFAKMTDHQKAHHAALEKLIAAERAMADASAGLAAAQAAHEAAVKAAAEG